MSPNPNTVAIGMITVLIAVIVYDIYLDRDKVTGNTYSEIIRGWFESLKWLLYLFCLAVGILTSHWLPR